MSVDLFGRPAAIDRRRFEALPAAMQGEGVRLMLERGYSAGQVATHLHAGIHVILDLAGRRRPFQRGGEVIEKGKG